MLPDLSQPLQRPPWALLCWTLLWWAPFTVSRHTLPWTSFYGEALAAVLSSLGVLLTWGPRPSGEHASVADVVRPLRGLLLGWSGWAMLVLLQPWQMPIVAPEVNRFAAGGMVLAMLAMLGGAGSRRWPWSRRVDQGLALILVLGGLLTVGGQLLQLAGLDEAYGPLIMTMAHGSDRRLFGNLGQANHAATYLVWALAGLMYLVQRFDVRPGARRASRWASRWG